MRPRVFVDLRVLYRPHQGAVVSWQLDPRFCRTEPGPYVFYLDVSRAGSSEWEAVSSAADTYVLEDPWRRLYTKSARLHYRVTVKPASGRSYVSPLVVPDDYRITTQRGLYRGMLRREHLLAFKKAGRLGWYFKRRHWGQHCTRCRSFDTGEIVDSETCEDCLGTGVIGGYFPPLPLAVVLKSRSPRRQKVEEPRGTTDDAVVVGRIPACVWPDTRDVWIDAATGVAHVLQKVQSITFRGAPLAYDPVELRVLPFTSPETGLLSIVPPETGETVFGSLQGVVPLVEGQSWIDVDMGSYVGVQQGSPLGTVVLPSGAQQGLAVIGVVPQGNTYRFHFSGAPETPGYKLAWMLAR